MEFVLRRHGTIGIQKMKTNNLGEIFMQSILLKYKLTVKFPAIFIQQINH
jgi:hypothetical protein